MIYLKGFVKLRIIKKRLGSKAGGKAERKISLERSNRVIARSKTPQSHNIDSLLSAGRQAVAMTCPLRNESNSD